MLTNEVSVWLTENAKRFTCALDDGRQPARDISLKVVLQIFCLLFSFRRYNMIDGG